MPEAIGWYASLDPRTRARVGPMLDALSEHGPNLRGDYVKRIRTSRYHHMKELRSFGGHQRALFAFDPQGRAVVLLGGDKAGRWRSWYRENIQRADEIYARHLRGTGQETRWERHRAGSRSAPRSR